MSLLFGETKEQLEERTEVLEVTELKLGCVTATLDATKKVCVSTYNAMLTELKDCMCVHTYIHNYHVCISVVFCDVEVVCMFLCI